MADLTANDITVTLDPRDIEELGMGKKISFPKISFGGEGKFYGSNNGIPLPSMGSFGMKKEVKRSLLEQPGDGYQYVIDRSDQANLKLRIFYACLDLKFIEGTGGDALGVDVTNVELETTTTGGKTILGADAATKGGVLPGPMVEVPATFAPGATVLEGVVIGQ